MDHIIFFLDSPAPDDKHCEGTVMTVPPALSMVLALGKHLISNFLRLIYKINKTTSIRKALLL